MGFRYRKSIHLGGGFRINVSKSGVGYSWGGKGFRITQRVDGKVQVTASIPGTGISYTEVVGNPKSTDTQGQTLLDKEIPIETGSVDNFHESSFDDVAQAIQQTLKYNTASTILICCLLICALHPAYVILGIAGIALKIYVHTKGRIDLEYTLDEETAIKYQQKMDAWHEALSCNAVWQVLAERNNSNLKVNAGAARTVSRHKLNTHVKFPFYVQSNVDAICLKLKNETLLIFPDKVFVIRSHKVGAIDLSEIRISVQPQAFIESEHVPTDTQILGYTWQYVNKNGTPDKRYKNNRQLPRCLYGDITLWSASGLNVELQCSNHAKVQKISSN